MSAFTPISNNMTSVPPTTMAVPVTTAPAAATATATATVTPTTPSIFRTQRIYRIVENGVSVATAITMADNTLLQVKPSKRSFATQRDWIADALTNSNGAITITCTENQVPLPYNALTTDAQRRLWIDNQNKRRAQYRMRIDRKKYELIKNAKNTESSMARAIRSIFDQYGDQDNLSMSGYRLTLGSPLYALIGDGIVPVFFNRYTSKVFPENLPREYTPTTMFFRRISAYSMNSGLKRIIPDLIKPEPSKKVIVVQDSLSGTMYMNNALGDFVKKVQNKGYFVKLVQGGIWSKRFGQVRVEYASDPDIYDFVRFNGNNYGRSAPSLTIFRNLPAGCADRDASVDANTWLNGLANA
jgi:hypothetical protein